MPTLEQLRLDVQPQDRAERAYGRFAMIPVDLSRNPNISSHAVRVFVILDGYADRETGTAFPAHASIAKHMGVSVPTVRRAIKELVEAGYLSTRAYTNTIGMRIGTIYTLFNPPRSSPNKSTGPGASVITSDHAAACSQVITPVVTGEQGPDHGRSRIHNQGRESDLLFEDKPSTSASGKSRKKQEINSAREQSINSAREGGAAPRPPQKNPDVLPLLARHVEAYRNKVGAPFPVAWARDGAIVKNQLKVYTREEIEALQDAFFAQKLDSEAARRGYTVSQFAYEAPALMTAIKLREGLTDEQKDLAQALRDKGVTQDTAISLVREHDSAVIQAQIVAHAGRRERFANPAAALVKAIREGWAVPPLEEEPDYFKPIRLASHKADAPPPEIQALLDSTLEQLTGKKAAT